MSDTTNPSTEPVNLSPERKKEIEALADKYYEEIKKAETLHPEPDSVEDLSKLIHILDKSSTSGTDFLSMYFSDVTGLLQKSTLEYNQEVELYFLSPIVKLLVGNDSRTALTILNHFKKVLTTRPMNAISKQEYGSLIELYRLMQLSCLNTNPVKQFASTYQDGSVYPKFIIELYKAFISGDFRYLVEVVSKYLSITK